MVLSKQEQISTFRRQAMRVPQPTQGAPAQWRRAPSVVIQVGSSHCVLPSLSFSLHRHSTLGDQMAVNCNDATDEQAIPPRLPRGAIDVQRQRAARRAPEVILVLVFFSSRSWRRMLWIRWQICVTFIRCRSALWPRQISRLGA